MGLIEKDEFVCFDIEATGLDTKRDRIIEIAAVRFTFNQILESKENLINPGISIPEKTIAIHHITDDMVKDKPPIEAVLNGYLHLMNQHILIGHGITFDIAILDQAALQHGITSHLTKLPYLDTLRMARLYGESPTNSLDTLRAHFNIQSCGMHRAMSDVLINIEVFKRLSVQFKTTEALLKRLEKPILLKTMPLGKYKGRFFQAIPLTYLQWAVRQDFDQDLLYSLKTELKKRKQGNLFSQASNPFSSL